MVVVEVRQGGEEEGGGGGEGVSQHKIKQPSPDRWGKMPTQWWTMLSLNLLDSGASGCPTDQLRPDKLRRKTIN